MGTSRGPDGDRSERLRILVAEDDPGYRAVLCEVLADDPSLEVVATAADAVEAIELAERERPDVALIDVRMPGGGGVRASEEIQARSPATRVVAISAYTAHSIVLDMVRAGAVGYVVKGAPLAEIVDAVHRCANGEVRLAGEVAGGVVAELAERLERQRRFEAELDLREQRIRSALSSGGPNVVVQPIARLHNGEVVGFEALARFDAALRESPIPWFEEADMVDLRVDLELAAVRSAVRAATVGADEGVWVSLNVSPATALATDELLEAVSPLGGRRVVVELTEQAEVEDYDALKLALARLREAGIRIAVDDAGAGYASLRHILRLAPDFIKLDRSLVAGIHSDRPQRALAKALISFADEIDATIVAEGIETERELEALRELGVSLGQGYHLAEPHRPPVEALVAVA